jgi:hypothetical protein
MTFAYDRQTIVQHEPNPADETIPKGTAGLVALAKTKNIPTVVVDLPVAGQAGQHEKMGKLVAAMSPMTAKSRLYLRGHGCWMMQTVGGIDAKTWARTLLNAGLYKTKVISITACTAGRDRDVMDNRVVHSADSFASQFHQALMDMANLDTVVYARVYNQIVYATGFKATSDLAEGIKPANSRAKSKLKFSWQGRKQVREWVDYSTGGTSSLGNLPQAEWLAE